MSHTLVVLFAFSVTVPSAVAIVRFKKINHIYLPFLLCIWIGLLNECISFVLIDIFHRSNAVNTNIYSLLEALLYTWLFRNLNLFASRRQYIFLIFVLCVAWLVDSFISGFGKFDSFFTILYSLIIVLMSITVINRLFFSQVNLLVNSGFLICTALIVYFTLFALMELFWLYGLSAGRSFRLNIYRIMAYVNLIVNLIFALAIVWMHRKQEFTLPQ